ncbi:MAG TPA: hypothetical protein VNX65_05300 [Patescibacteria group bacterium]|jgi:hypothetical protein|nr:hypothetical protein [Patescibacteria group bacterium]
MSPQPSHHTPSNTGKACLYLMCFWRRIPVWKTSKSGFMLPSVITISAVLLIMSLAIAQFIIANQQVLVQGMFKQITQTAAKSGSDYAQEQFTSTGTYNGTSEQTITSNNRYRVTFAVTVLSTSADGFTKKIESTGRVYRPATSTTVLLSSTIRSSIYVNSPNITPDKFSPIAWYDASNNPTVHQLGTQTNNWTDYNTNTATYMNERISDGAQNSASWNDTTLTFGYNANLNATTYTGMLFSLTPIPKTATITSAYIQFKAAGLTSPGSDTVKVEALAYAGVPSSGSFSPPSASNQLTNQPVLAPNVSWNMPAWPVAGQSGVPQRSPDISALVQATLGQAQYNPAVNKIGFRFQRTSGTGTRSADRSVASLVVSYTTAGNPTQANNKDKVSIWDDISGNGRNLVAATGNEPTYLTNQQNGLGMVQFPYDRNVGGIGKSMQTSAFSLLNPASSGSMFIVAQGTNKSGDNAAFWRMDGIIPSELNCIGFSPCLQRVYELGRSGGSGDSIFYIQRVSLLGAYTGQSTTLSNSFLGSGAPNMLAGGVAFTPGSCNPSLALAALDFAFNSVYATSCPGAQSNPKSFQNGLTIYAGTGRAGAVLDGTIGEMIVYDKQLSCQQVQSLQAYLRIKWYADNTTSNIIACPPPQIPAF